MLHGDGKAQGRPLEMLALLAAQGGHPLDASSAIDTLQPSLEANAPRKVLDLALSRLRKLFRYPARTGQSLRTDLWLPKARGHLVSDV